MIDIDCIVKIRPWGTIVIANSILCDGENKCGVDDGKNITCYTHIHSDHIGGLEDSLGRFNSHVYATEITKYLSSALHMYDAEWIKDRSNYYGLKFKESIEIDNFKISFHKANHILGSAQLLVYHKNDSILYSSDFILEETEIIKDVDYLILDSTHGEHSKNQKFDDEFTSKKMIIKKTKEILEDTTSQLIIYANRGTMQLVMSWLRNELGPDIVFLANTTEKNIARVYSKYGYDCGVINEDEKFDKFYNNQQQCIWFRSRNLTPDLYNNVPSIRIGASSSTTLNNDQMSIVNLLEHATIDDILKYVKNINPKHIILDNSKRTSNPNNAKELKIKLIKDGFDPILLPETHHTLKF